jgi:hypothetical protein
MGCGCTKNAAVDPAALNAVERPNTGTGLSGGLEGAENEFTAVSSPDGSKGSHLADDNESRSHDADAQSR